MIQRPQALNAAVDERMIDFSRVRNYYIASGYTDMRKLIDGLVAVVQIQHQRELDETSLFLFCGRKADRVKVSTAV